jgi:integrase
MERGNAAGGINRTLRFHAYGKRRTVPLGGVSREEAERQLAFTLADVARGTWGPAQPGPAEPPAETPTFHDYSDEWWLLHNGQLAAKTRSDYRWRLEVHLIPHFGEMALDAITVDTVERYIAAKLAEGERIREAAATGEPILEEVIDRNGRRMTRPRQPMGPRSINMTVTLMAAILETAVERELVARNPAKGRGRRVRERASRRSYLETAGQIEALLGAAGALDQEATRERQHLHKRATLAAMVFAGLRISELCALRWRDVDLDAGWLTVGDSKTDAGRRRVKIRGTLHDELRAVRSRRTAIDQDAYVFGTRTGRRQYECNVREGTLGNAVKRANKHLLAQDLPPLPEHLTPHSLRRTFASVLYALGESPPVVMAEMGHTSPAPALRVYAQAMRVGEDERAELAALMGDEKAHKGTNTNVVPIEEARSRVA